MSSKNKIILLLMTAIYIIGNTQAGQKSCPDLIYESEYLKSYVEDKDNFNEKDITNFCGLLNDKAIENLKKTESGVVYRYVKYLNKYKNGPIKIPEWCKTYEELTCAEIFDNFKSFINCHKVNCIVAQVKQMTDENILSQSCVIQRYVFHIKSETQSNQLFWKDWCDKVEKLCLEPIRMLGFKIEAYAIQQFREEKNKGKPWKEEEKKRLIDKIITINKTHMKELSKIDVPNDNDTLKNYIKNLQSDDAQDALTYCTNDCAVKATNYNYSDSSFTSIQKLKFLGKTQITNFTKLVPQAASIGKKLIVKKGDPASPKKATEDEDNSESVKEKDETTSKVNHAIDESIYIKGFEGCLSRLKTVTESIQLKGNYSGMANFCERECI